jgi:hypothetical protein
MSQLYPRPNGKKKQSDRRWRVDYDLAYDGGVTHWSGYYPNKAFAIIATWWNVSVSSWGGTAFLYDQEKDK